MSSASFFDDSRDGDTAGSDDDSSDDGSDDGAPFTVYVGCVHSFDVRASSRLDAQYNVLAEMYGDEGWSTGDVEQLTGVEVMTDVSTMMSDVFTDTVSVSDDGFGMPPADTELDVDDASITDGDSDE